MHSVLAGWSAWLAAPVLLFGATTPSLQLRICDRLSRPVITAPQPNAVLPDTAVVLTGVTAPYSSVSVGVDDQEAAIITSDDDGSFQAQLRLSEGSNELHVRAFNLCESSATTTRAVLVRPSDGRDAPPVDEPQPAMPTETPDTDMASGIPVPRPIPELATGPADIVLRPVLSVQLVRPTKGLVTRDPAVFVGGYTNVASTVVVHGNNMALANLRSGGGSFGVRVPLKMGVNNLRVTAIRGGQTAEAMVSVRRIASDDPANGAAWYDASHDWATGTAIVGGPIASLAAWHVIWHIRYRRYIARMLRQAPRG